MSNGNEKNLAVLIDADNVSAKYIKSITPAEVHPWVDKFGAEAEAAVKANPMGSDPLEKTDCSQFADEFGKYKKGMKKRL